MAKTTGSRAQLVASHAHRLFEQEPDENVLESTDRKNLAETAEKLGASSAELDQLERADKKLRRGEELGPEESFALEAIIFPDKRPVIDVIHDRYQPPTQSRWQSLGKGEVRPRLEATLPAIGRVDLVGDASVPYLGTGFMIAPNLLLTNRHVADDMIQGLGDELRFISGIGGEVDFEQWVVPSDGFVLRVNRPVLIHPWWDAAILEVEGFPENRTPLALLAERPENLRGRTVATIGYPAFDPRNATDVQNRVFHGTYNVKRLQPGTILAERAAVRSFGNSVDALTHDCSTLGGNSGSAVIDVESGHVLALHFGGRYLEQNFAVPAWELISDPRIHDLGVAHMGEPHPAGSWIHVWDDTGLRVKAGSENGGSEVGWAQRASLADVVRTFRDGPSQTRELLVDVLGREDAEALIHEMQRDTRESEAGRDIALQELDSTVITNPLLTHMQQDNSRAKVHNVVLEVNLMHPKGMKDAKKELTERVRALIASANGKPKRRRKKSAEYTEGKPYLFERKSELGGHYIFADLTTAQISVLVSRYSNEEAQSATASTAGNADEGLIYKIWADFELDLYIDRSVSTVKADAARLAFGATGEDIVWAVVDTGVANHEHFAKWKNLELGELGMNHWDFTTPEPTRLKVEELVDEDGHGTHVAGIIAGETIRESDNPIRAVVYKQNNSGERSATIREIQGLQAVAPKCKIVSLKVIAPGDNKGPKGLTRDLITALAHIRDVNGDGPVNRIHGVNISLGHDFDPRWFACGSSPVCRAVDKLVKSGVVVVVAAGNGGYGERLTTFKGTIDGGLSLTIRDPGNAMLAITVGATHGYMPHDYGVSYFSAKGPTGDGRLKPDLVAPGEKIVSCAGGRYLAECSNARGENYIEMSGTSQAAPHVSGCIAAFFSLRREFRGRPERTKDLFLDNATDLGRERYFQGHGLVDLMRAIQSV